MSYIYISTGVYTAHCFRPADSRGMSVYWISNTEYNRQSSHFDLALIIHCAAHCAVL